ncbi:MAG TPA: bifunctional phosphopantothenoylcysteine decarboxylase/phosphopantothenate--cysteine ligase CoaBC [Anaerolineales bacterium]|nr:bifunctional phosphopantothenoylcysteine decarboxylase/phosphopantothenate--cysteine ligase CoaBC [Anaerolineales bacterium]
MATTPTIPLLTGRKILLGVTGSIACYKAVDLASRLTQAGALVDVVLSEAARQFVTPLTFASVTGRRAYVDADMWQQDSHLLHVALGGEAEVMIVAPATAHTLAKLAAGHGDTLLCLAALASRAPFLVAPAMDAGMFDHPATQANLAVLQSRGTVVLGPAEGRMASGLVGLGRMLEPDEILGHMRQVLGRAGPLAGHTVLVTAGGTHEPIDPVRVIANRSSGRQGFALAQAAIDRGAVVTLVTGPSTLTAPVGAQRIDIGTAAEMQEAVLSRLEGTDVLLMAAAVADFRSESADQKIKREHGERTLVLKPTDDILAQVGARRKKISRPRVVVGFAAESESLVENARAKVRVKGIDLIVANDIQAPDAGFAVETNRVTLIDSSGTVQELPLMTKAEVAETVLDRVAALL